jgi:glucose-6-phosphate 1-dehydrogenase
VGYARSDIAPDEFKKKISSRFGDQHPQQLKDAFLEKCWYHKGQYDKAEDFKKLDEELQKAEQQGANGAKAFNRIFYMALPPTAFVPAAKSIAAAAMSKRGWNRIVVEKPFGRDTKSSEELGRELSALFAESQLYRIDHYLGKEMVQNLITLRFANRVRM